MVATGYVVSGGGPAHSHSTSEVAGLDAALADRATDTELSTGLAGKAPTVHSHSIANVTGLQDALDSAGGGSSISIVRAVLSSGDVVPPVNGAWTPLAGISLAIPAQVGDEIELGAAGMFLSASDSFFEFCVVAGGVPVRFSSTNTGTASIEGDPAVYPAPGLYRSGLSFAMSFVATSGDIEGGNVTFGIAHLGQATGKFFASTNYPFRWRAINYGGAA